MRDAVRFTPRHPVLSRTVLVAASAFQEIALRRATCQHTGQPSKRGSIRLLDGWSRTLFPRLWSTGPRCTYLCNSGWVPGAAVVLVRAFVARRARRYARPNATTTQRRRPTSSHPSFPPLAAVHDAASPTPSNITRLQATLARSVLMEEAGAAASSSPCVRPFFPSFSRERGDRQKQLFRR